MTEANSQMGNFPSFRSWAGAGYAGSGVCLLVFNPHALDAMCTRSRLNLQLTNELRAFRIQGLQADGSPMKEANVKPSKPGAQDPKVLGVMPRPRMHSDKAVVPVRCEGSLGVRLSAFGGGFDSL